ncbi:MAG: mannitol dehydrogenase family protein, partial [Pseudomonadota bacterium]
VRAAIRDRQVEHYIDHAVRFPSSMVDRITPATTEADRAELAALTGLHDAWPVVTEPFTQWVVEDKFAGDRPPFSGVDWVADVAPYEEAKLRLLNGAHTTLAMLGPMLGHRFVDEAVADPALRRLIDRTAREEVIPHLSLGRSFLETYWKTLLERFENPALHHALDQIASDTSQKVSQRLVAPLIEARRAGQSAPGLVLAIAAWLEHIRQAARAGRALRDPLGDWLADVAQRPPEAALRALSAPEQPLRDFTPDLVKDVLAAHRILDRQEGAALAERLKLYAEPRDA